VARLLKGSWRAGCWKSSAGLSNRRSFRSAYIIPHRVHDNFDAEHTHGAVTFQLAGQKYMRRFNIDDDWVDTDFLTYVFGLAAELKLDGRFYSLPGDGQVAHFIYLTQARVLTEKYKLELE
jgi:hypothetical protein